MISKGCSYSSVYVYNELVLYYSDINTTGLTNELVLYYSDINTTGLTIM